MTQRDTFRLRLGLLCLFASGIFSIVGLFFRGPVIHPPSQFAQEYVDVALSGTHEIAWILLLPNLVFQVFGWFAFYVIFANTKYDRFAFWGMVLSIIGNGLFLPIVGVIAFVSPAVAELYQAGMIDVMQVADMGMAGPLALPFLMVSGLTLLFGVILHGIVMWRSKAIPTWIAPLYIWHGIGLTVMAEVDYRLEYSGAIALLISATVLTVALWKHVNTLQAQPAQSA